jgi:hypothetical protein
VAKIDLHKLALTAGFEVVCVDDDYTNYEYMIRLKDIESMSYVLKIKNDILRFNIKKLKDGATGTSDLVYNGWNV